MPYKITSLWRAAECWGGESSSSSSQPAVSGSTPSKIICYTCREEGHKSTQCPKIKVEKMGPKEADNVKPLRRIWRNKNHDTVLSMKVNSQEASVLLDSGSSITVVPEPMVAQARRTGDTVAVKAFGAKKHLVLLMAEVSFEVGSLRWVEPVALAPVEDGFEKGVVYGLDLLSKRGMDLVLIANQGNQANKRRLTAWAQAEEYPQGEKEEAVAGAVEKSCEVSTGEGDSVADRPAEAPKPVASEIAIGKRRSGAESLVEKDEEGCVESLAVEKESSEERDEPRHLRRLIVLTKLDIAKEEGREVGGVGAQLGPDSSVVGRMEAKLEAYHHSEVCFCNLCINLVPSMKHRRQNMEQSDREDQLRRQPRSPAFVSIGGDVGTAHIEKREEGGTSPHRRRKKKNLEEDKVQRAHDSAD